jgi:hypothetical protein
MSAPKENRAEPSSEPQNIKDAAAARDQAEANKSQSAANQSAAEGQTGGAASGDVGGNPSE